MTTTVKELVEFLQAYPEDSTIHVTKEVQSPWSISTEVVDLELDGVEIIDLRVSDYFTEEDEDFGKVQIRLVAN